MYLNSLLARGWHRFNRVSIDHLSSSSSLSRAFSSSRLSCLVSRLPSLSASLISFLSLYYLDNIPDFRTPHLSYNMSKCMPICIPTSTSNTPWQIFSCPISHLGFFETFTTLREHPIHSPRYSNSTLKSQAFTTANAIMSMNTFYRKS
jgi:hypothetical protein